MDISVLYKIPTENILWESSDEEEETEIIDENDVTIDSTVEHVYIMNRISDITKWSAVVQSIQRSDIGLKYYTRFPKIDHEKERYKKEWKKTNFKNIRDYTKTQTILNILKDALAKKYRSILILNDTARFHSNSKRLFKTQLQHIERVDKNWKVIHLAVREAQYNNATDKNFYYPKITTRCDYSFIIKNDIYENIIKTIKTGTSIDNALTQYNNSKKVFVTYPNIVLNTNNKEQYGKQLEGYTIIPRPKNSPLISVIMTAHNSEKYISYSIESILSQTYTNIELIIVDDASKDKTSKIIREYAGKDSRILHLNNKINYGTYVSKNIGIKHSKGQYITFQDSDDYSIRNRLELQLNALKNSNDLVCFGKYVNKEMRLNFCEITLFMRRDVVDFIGYFDSVRFGADTEYRKRLEILKIPICVLNNYIYSRLDRLIEGNKLGNRNSLTNSKKTGLTSKARLIYRKSFECYHTLIKTKRGMSERSYYIPFPIEKRPFEILVNHNLEKSLIIVKLNQLDKYLYKVKL